MGLIVLTIGLAGWLGYQALTAAASHRRVAEAVLHDYAGIAAAEFARVSRTNLHDVLDETFSPVARRLRGRGTPPAEVVRWELDDAMRHQRCRCPGFRDPAAVFRFELPSGEAEFDPDTLGLPVRGAILRTATSVSERPGQSRRGIALVPSPDPASPPLALGYMLVDDVEGSPESIYGFVVEVEALGELFQLWYEGQTLLPPPIAGGQPNDSLLFVTVSEPGGHPLFTSPVAFSTGPTAGAPLGSYLPDVEVRASLRPEAAAQLVIGGLPGSKLPFLLTLLLLTVGVGVAAAVQLRREQQFQRIRADFVSGVSHELRTPLAQIRMFAELQEAGRLVTEEDRARATSIIHRESRRLTHLVENILQFSRLRRSDQSGLPVERMDLAEALTDGMEAMRPLFIQRGDRLTVERESGLEVVTNRHAITRILVNLLDNAFKYGPAGQSVVVSVSRSGDSARLTVSDQGPGVPAEDRERIWQPYRRLDRDAGSATPGTGIGLAVVRGLASGLGARTWVETVPGGGARFIVEFALASPTDGDTAETVLTSDLQWQPS